MDSGHKHLQGLLKQLQSHPYPEIPSPEATKRRASVALVIRIQPSYDHWPTASAERPRDLDAFFVEEWVRHGEAEVLFIKRASRKGDRWTSHVALPGGKRDPEDADDEATAARETWEEVGLDLSAHALQCGNLPQRLVTTHWGKKPLLVLCPYLYILTSHDIPPLKLQPTEVAATHWVPIHSLLEPARRTAAFEDVSSRLANEETGAKRWMLRLILGKMMFAGIALLPTETLHSAERWTLQKLQDNRKQPRTYTNRVMSLVSRIWNCDLFNQFPPQAPEGELLLWGLTLGVVSDFLDLLPPHNALTLWMYPSFTPLDVRFLIWFMTYRFKHRKRVELQAGHNPSFGYASESVPLPLPANHDPSSEEDDAITASTVVVPRPDVGTRPDETGLHGLGSGISDANVPVGVYGKRRKAAVATMLEGCVTSITSFFMPEIADRARYYDIVRRAVAVAVAGRISVAALITWIVWTRVKTRRRAGLA